MALVLAATAAMAAGKAKPEQFESGKSQQQVVACITQAISTFDNPVVTPAPNGDVRIVTKFLHATRIDLTVSSSPTTKVQATKPARGKLKQIVQSCL